MWTGGDYLARQHSLFHGTLLLTAASITLRASSMCFQVFLSNRIGAAGIGLLQLISSVGFLAMTLGSAGVRVASMYLTAEEYGARRPGGMRKALLCCLCYGLIASTLGAAALHCAADWISIRWIQDARAASSLKIMAFCMPVSCMWSVMSGYFTACSRLRHLVWVEFIDQGISIVLTVSLLMLWAGADTERACMSIALGNLISTAITLLLLLLFAFAERRVSIPQGLSMWKRLFRVSLPLAANDALRSGLSTTEQMLIPRGLARSGASSEHAMASYGTIHGMVFPIMMFPCVVIYSLSDLLVPELAKCRAAKDWRRVYALSERCVRMGLLFAASIAGLCYALAEPLANLLYKSESAGFYLKCFAPLVLILYMDAMVDGMHKGMGEQMYCVRINTITNLLDVIFLWLLLPRYGIAGYFFTFTLTHLLNFFLSLTRLMKVTRYTPSLTYALKIILNALGATVITCYFCRTLAAPLSASLLGAGIYLLVFPSLLILTRTLNSSDTAWLSKVMHLRKSN